MLAWRILFTEILDQLAEFDGVATLADFQIDQENEEKKLQNYKKSKQLEPSFTATLESKTISIDYINIPKVEIKYYVIDPEVLFSRTPFVSQGTEDFSFTKPMVAFTHVLDKDQKVINIPIDKEYETKNMVIEVSAVGKQQYLTYYSTNLKVQVIENYGELKVTDEKGNPLSKVYVKAFAKYNSGSDKFFKDGYTDFRGKFEYAQTNSNKLKDIQKFAILVKSDDKGAITKEVKPPANIE